MFRPPFNVYGAVITFKTLNEIKQNEIFFFKFNFFKNENLPPTRHVKYKTIDFAPCNKSIMAKKLLSTNLERFLRRIKSPLTR